MAVALATLPLNRLADGEGDACLATSAGAGVDLMTGAALTGTAFVGAGLAGTADLAAALPTGLAGTAVFLATTFGAGLTAAFLTAALFSGFLTGAFLTGAFFAATFFTGAAFLGAAFLATGFVATFFAGDLGAAFLAALTTFLAAAGLAGDFLATGLAGDFAEVLLALFTVDPLVAATLDLPVLTSLALAEDDPFAALEAVAVRVVFAISLHQFSAVAAGCYSPRALCQQAQAPSSPCIGQLTSGILALLHAAGCAGNVNVASRLILSLLRFYKRWLSPLLGPRCRFQPSCSDYARIAVTRFGPWRGSLLAGWRLLRCQPLCTGGDDPVPEHFHYPRCRTHGESTDAP